MIPATDDDVYLENRHRHRLQGSCLASQGYTLPKGCQVEQSLSHMSRTTTERRARTAREWIRPHIKLERRYKPPVDAAFAETAPRCQKVPGRKVLPTPVRPRGDRLLSPRADGPGRFGRVSVVPVREEAVAVPLPY